MLVFLKMKNPTWTLHQDVDLHVYFSRQQFTGATLGFAWVLWLHPKPPAALTRNEQWQTKKDSPQGDDDDFAKLADFDPKKPGQRLCNHDFLPVLSIYLISAPPH